MTGGGPRPGPRGLVLMVDPLKPKAGRGGRQPIDIPLDDAPDGRGAAFDVEKAPQKAARQAMQVQAEADRTGQAPPGRRVRVAVLVSGGGTNLQALIDAKVSGALPSASLVAVISSTPQAKALKRAEAAGIPARVVERKAYPSPAAFDAALLAQLRAHRAEVVVLAGFMSILGPQVLAAYQNAIINVHPSLIPAFCGAGFYGLRVHQAALERGVKLTGATVHFVNEVVDGGEIILQKAVAVEHGDTPETLQRRVMEQAEWQILPKALEMVCRSKAQE